MPSVSLERGGVNAHSLTAGSTVAAKAATISSEASMSYDVILLFLLHSTDARYEVWTM